MTHTSSHPRSVASKLSAVVWAVLLVVSAGAVSVDVASAAGGEQFSASVTTQEEFAYASVTDTDSDTGDTAVTATETEPVNHTDENWNETDRAWPTYPETEPATGTVSTAGVTTTEAIAEYRVEGVLSGLNQPVGTAWLPDGSGRMLVLEKTGQIYIYDPPTGDLAEYMRVRNLATSQERGLQSIAFDPDFETNGYFYIHQTYRTQELSPRNIIARFEHDENTGGTTSQGDFSSRVILWEEDKLADQCCHYGGGLGFGPDGKLYLSTGDHFNGTNSQDTTTMVGKLIRLNPDGTVPADNPYVDDPSVPSYIYSIGLRNPYRMTVDEVTGNMYMGQVGGNQDDGTAWEEIELVQRDVNYGWPTCEGFCNDSRFVDPVYAYQHRDVTPPGEEFGGAVTIGPVYRGDLLPGDVHGSLIVGDYVHGFLRYLVLDESGQVVETREIFPTDGLPQYIVHYSEGPDGAIYMSNIAFGTVTRLVYAVGNNAPVITDVSANVTDGPAPLSVAFSGTASDANDDPLTYEWSFGDGETATGPDVVHTYSSVGSYTAVLRVSDGNVTVESTGIEIQVGSAPVATITAPADGATFRAGDVIPFTGEATDAEDGALPSSATSWEIRFIHNEHFHPASVQTNETGGQLEIGTRGHDYTTDTSYELRYTATDSDGLSDTDIVRLYPEKVNFTVRTDPAGLGVDVDSIPRPTPVVLDTLIDFEHQLAAPLEQCAVDGTRYVFANWSDGGARTHYYTVPDTDVTVTANYQVDGTCAGLPTAGLVGLYETDRGVTATGLRVTGWPDESGVGNDLTALGEPSLAAGVANGQDAVVFDGTDDALIRENPTNLPAGAADRTLFAVVRYDTPGFGGVGYGDNRGNEAFSLGVNPEGKLMLQGWGTSNDFPSTVDGTGAGWLVQSLTYEDGRYAMYRDGTAILTGEHTFDTDPAKLLMGANLNERDFVGMGVGAFLIYDRALSESERLAVESYLAGKYLETSTDPGPSVRITAPRNGTTVRAGLTVAWEAVEYRNGDHVHLTLDNATVHTTIRSLDGTYTYGALDPGVHTVRIEVADRDHRVYTNQAAAAEVTIVVPEALVDAPLPESGLVVRLEPAGLYTDDAGVTSWRDATRRANHVVAVGNPQVVAGGLAGADYVALDGDDALVRSNTVRGAPTGDDDRTVFAVVRHPSDRAPVSAGVAYGRPAEGQAFGLVARDDGDIGVDIGGASGNSPDANLPAAGTGWYVQAASLAGGTLTVYRDGIPVDERPITLDTRRDRLVIGAGLDGVPAAEMDVGAVLVYDRALSGTERRAVESYLAQRYFGVLPPASNAPPVANNDSLTVPYAGTATVDVVQNDDDLDGALDPSSLSFTEQPSYGKVSIVDPGAVRYDHLGEGLTDSFRYVVYDQDGAVSNEAVVSVTVDNGTGTTTVETTSDEGAVEWASDESEPLESENETSTDTTKTDSSVNEHTQTESGREETTPATDGDGASDPSPTDSVDADDTNASEDQDVELNQPPTAGSDEAVVERGGTVQIDVTANDRDPDGSLSNQSLRVWLAPTSGSVSVRDGVVVYTHDGNGKSVDSFVYRVIDDDGAVSNLAVVTVTVLAPTPNESPIAVDDRMSVERGGSVRIDVLANDDDADGSLDPTSLSVWLAPTAGSVRVEDGAIVYTSDGRTRQADSFVYQVRDDDGAVSNLAVVTVSIVDPTTETDTDQTRETVETVPDGSGSGSETDDPTETESASESASPATDADSVDGDDGDGA
jgi:glucose/arabinose dehydrogenase